MEKYGRLWAMTHPHYPCTSLHVAPKAPYILSCSGVYLLSIMTL